MNTIFVSSTFSDFQYERDVLHDVVQPRLGQLAARYDESVRLCDLRWGIDTSGKTESEADRQVLGICLDEIDRSRPYMIVLLGSRYGYQPGGETIARELGRRDLTLADSDISVTHL